MPNDIVIANLGGESITLADLLRHLQAGGHYRSFLQEIGADRVVRREARARGITVGDEELQEAVDRFRAERDLLDETKTEQWLKENGLELSQLEEEVESSLLRNKLMQALATKDAITAHFQKNRDPYASARISRIVVSSQGLAAELMKEIVEEGVDFATLARKHSIDRPSAVYGGSIGWVYPGDLEEVEEQRVFGARPGEILGPLGVACGYGIIRVEAMRAALLTDETRARIAKTIFREWIEQQLNGTPLRMVQTS